MAFLRCSTLGSGGLETEASVRAKAGAIDDEDDEEEMGWGRWDAMVRARDANLVANMMDVVLCTSDDLVRFLCRPGLSCVNGYT